MTMDSASIQPAQCAWEDHVVRAATAGPVFSPALRSHLADCASCRAAAVTVRALAEHGRAAELDAFDRVASADAIIALAGSSVFAQPPALPRWSPGLAARVLRPLVWIERSAIVIATLVFLTMLSWIAPIGGAPGTSIDAPVTANPSATPTEPATGVVALIAVLIVGIAGYGLVGLGSVRPAGGLLTRTR